MNAERHVSRAGPARRVVDAAARVKPDVPRLAVALVAVALAAARSAAAPSAPGLQDAPISGQTIAPGSPGGPDAPLRDPAAVDREIEDLQARVAADPDDLAARRTLVARLMEARRFAAAEQAALGLGAEGRAVRGTALYLLARYEEALDLLDPADPLAGLMRVDALLALGRAADADAAIDALAGVRGEDDPRVLALRGRQLARRGRHAEAVEPFRRALERDPLDREALFGLGQALTRSGRREEGLALLARHRQLVPLLDERDFALQSLQLDPGHAPNHALLGDVERKLGQLESAERRYETAASLATADEVVPIALREARLLAEDCARLDDALAVLDRAATRVADPRLAVRAGDLLAEAGRVPQARARYLAALALRPGDAQVQARLDALPAEDGP